MRLLVTQTRPFGAIATLRGDPPTAISATRLPVAVSITATVSESGLATQRRVDAPARVSSAIAEEAVGLPLVADVATAWRKLREEIAPPDERIVKTTL